MSIQDELNQINNAVYGSEVRTAIHDSIKKTYDDASANGNANMEVKMARGTFPVLNDRLGKLDDKNAETNAQLAEKANDSEVRKKNIPISEGDVSDSLKQQINGNAPILQTVADEIVTPKKTSFIRSVNIFNKDATEKGSLDAAGEVLINDTYFTTEYIRANEGDVIRSTHSISGYVIYNASFTFVSAERGISATEITIPQGAYYVRFYALNNRLDILVMTKNSELPPLYKPYKEVIETNLIEGLNNNNFSGKWDKTDLSFASLKNMFNKETVTTGSYINELNGNLSSNANYSASDYINVESGVEYSVSHFWHGAYYDEANNFISAVELPIIPPEPATRIRLSVINTVIENFQFEKGSTKTLYEPYGYKIDDEHIRFSSNVEVSGIDINLPNTLYGVTGETLHINFDNVIKDYSQYNIKINSSEGVQLTDKYELTPNSTGYLPVEFEVYENDTKIANKEINVEIASKEKNGGDIECLFIGDSTTSYGKYTETLLNLFQSDVTTINLLGANGTSPNNHEGRSGWAVRHYADRANVGETINPFFNNGFDFSYYMNEQGYSGVNMVFIHLGINDIFAFETVEQAEQGFPSVIANFDKMVNSIHSYDNTIKIGLMVTIPPSFNQDHFGESYGTTKTRWEYYNVYQRWITKFIGTYDGRKTENIYLVPIHSHIDSVTGFGNSTQSPAVHPNDSGYEQIAEPIYCFIKNVS